MKIVTILQARTNSSRLPGKVLLPLVGASLLERMVERVRAARVPMHIVVATTRDACDDVIVSMCRGAGIDCFRGHPTDLLDRHFRAAVAFGGDAVVKIPSDCPLVDPGIIERVVGAFVAARDRLDFVSNLHPASWPDGNDVEIMSLDALEIAHREAEKLHEREHTTPFLWDQPERFRVGNVRWEAGLDLSMTHRFTIDYPEDYEFVRAVYEALWSKGRVFGLDEILELLRERPALFRVNAKYAGVNWYRHHLDALRTVSPDQTRSP